MKKILAIAVMITAFALALASCDNGNNDDDPIPPVPPIGVSTLDDLNAIKANAANMGKNYKLMADISGVTTPIGLLVSGQPLPFTGDFDGNGHTITLNITTGFAVTTPPYIGTYAGLFAVTGDMSGSGGSVHDLAVVGTINITGGGEGFLCAGGVTGITFPSAAVKKVSSSVNVTLSGSGRVMAGSIVGVSQGTISNVYATGNVSATTTGTNPPWAGETSITSDAYAGGIAGVGTGAVNYAYATGTISAAGTGKGQEVDDGDRAHVNAAGIVGSASGGTVKYTVALNSSVSATNTPQTPKYAVEAYRVASAKHGVLAGGVANYGNTGMTLTGSGSLDKGADQQGGLDLTVAGGPPPTAYTTPAQSWWTDSTAWSGTDWSRVWKWDNTKGRPVLWWE